MRSSIGADRRVSGPGGGGGGDRAGGAEPAAADQAGGTAILSTLRALSALVPGEPLSALAAASRLARLH